MPGNSNLHDSSRNKQDEFYTNLQLIEDELKHYRAHFKGKRVLCNCDDPYESNFFKYFAMSFNSLGLKSLTATCYATSPVVYTQLDLFGDDGGLVEAALPKKRRGRARTLRHYTPEEYPKYDNYDAIEVAKTADIPKDWDGAIGVPITFMQYHNPDQFEILGATESEGVGFSAGLWNADSGIAQPMMNGGKKYKRIFIRWRFPIF